jgi:hypothetical protein
MDFIRSLLRDPADAEGSRNRLQKPLVVRRPGNLERREAP